MADKVETIMEKMVDEFKHYQELELFSKKEIRQLVRRRRQHEYTLQAKTSELLQFIDAIKFEKQLERLRAKRKKALNIDEKKAKINFYDSCVKRRIMYLYERAVRKFKSNLALWKEYLGYLA